MTQANPDPDFQDDGGTRAWRANQATFGPIIDGRRRGKRISEWTVKETFQALFALLVLGTVVPFIILFGGLILLGIWDHITR